MHTRRFAVAAALSIASMPAAGACASGDEGPGDQAVAMNEIAPRYVRLVLALGRHDADYVDAYFGPPELKAEVEAAVPGLDAIAADAAVLRRNLPVAASGQEMDWLRREHLDRQLASLAARVRMLQGERLTFDEETQALYDAVAPAHPESHFQAILRELEAVFPGRGPLVSRYEAWRQAFVIPRERLDAVFQTAIRACRERTAAHIALPADESFTVEYVTGKSWSGYNWYQGGFRSLIQVNTDLPIYVDRALDLACHEGYPGHHVYNLLIEQHLVRDRGWVEFTVYPLFSPRSLIAEGTANFGIDVAFPGQQRLEYEKGVLFPAAGLDPRRADEYYRVQKLVEQLDYAVNEAARRYLNGEIDAAAAARWLEQHALMPAGRATQRVRFIDQYRSYVINYNLGRDMVRDYIEARGGTPDDRGRRWEIFADLLSSPRLPLGLK